MKKSTVLYASAISVIGIAVGIYCCVRFFSGENSGSSTQILLLMLLLVLCRCLPLYVREDCAVEMSFISILTIFLLEGPVAAAAMYLVTTPFVVTPVPGEQGKLSHIFNTSPIKSAFNTGNVLISIALAGLVCSAVGMQPGDTELPGVLLPIVAYVVVSMIANTAIMSVLLKLESDVPISRSLLVGFGQFVPNIICAAPLGYFFAFLLGMRGGSYMMILFLLPLLLARFSFKMYLDTKQQQQYKVIKALTAAIEAKDQYTVGHSRRVEMYSEMIAREMRLSQSRIEIIKIAALFHDIGKIGVKDTTLNKPDVLSADEREEIMRHPEISVHIIEDIDFYGNIKDIILCHHERCDGNGYPAGKTGKDIPLESHILSVADAFDAMTSDRPYRKGFSIEKAISILEEESGKQFLPIAVDAMLSLYRSGALARCFE